MGRITIPTSPGVITCKRAMDILIYVEANYPDHAARADGYGNRWVVTITSTADPEYVLRRLYAQALPLMIN